MTYYPVYLNLSGRKVLVVGGGDVAERKVRGLLEAGAEVRVVSPKLNPGLMAQAREGAIEYRARPFQQEDLEEAFLVISATNDPSVNERVYHLAQARKIFCNVVDQSSLCSFIAPAVIRRGDIQIAISTGGQSPALAVRIKKEIASIVDEAYAELSNMLASLRSKVVSWFPNPETRAAVFRAIVDSEALDLLRLGKRDQAEHLIDEIIARHNLE